MNDDQISVLLDVAVSKQFLSSSQAELLKEEMFMFPGGNMLSMMIRRGVVSPDQARELELETARLMELKKAVGLDAGTSAGANHDHDDDLDLSFGAPVSTRPPAPPNISPSMGTYPGAGTPVNPAPPPAPSSNSPTPSVQTPRPVFSGGESSSVRPATGITIEMPPRGKSGGIAPSSDMLRLFKMGREKGCSDFHVSVGKPPYFRKEGELIFTNDPPVTPEQAENWNRSVLDADQQEFLDDDLQVDFSFEHEGIGRFRSSVYMQRLGTEGAYRFIAPTPPTLDELGLPKVLEKLTTYPQGLNLVTGPGGCGKTTTVAAMLEYINTHRHEHIITVEDPVEYVFQPKQCQITQREVGRHTRSFAHALRTALRQDPDVIMIGEMRDLETTGIAITAAETGHLVFGTLHTSSAARTVARVLDVFPPGQRAQICLMVAESLRGIISQQLIPRKDGQGRVCAMEILLVTTGVSQIIKEGKTHQLISHMQSGRKLGMISMDDALLELVRSGVISGKVAYARGENKAAFEAVRTRD